MKKKLVILTLIIVITVVFLGLTQSIYAQENKPLMKQKMLPCKSGEFKEIMDKRLKCNPDMMMEEFIKSLNLSEEQVTEIKKVLLDFQKDTLELRNSLQVKELEVKVLLLEPLTEMTKIKAKYEEIAELQVEIRVKTIERYLEIKGLLTPEQQAKLPLGVPSQIFAYQKMGMGRGKMMKSYCW
ncbi:MAG: Spy/CpxP family protein refolding chaperone [Candidatus Atribacteria bacterium]|nr:Spy/CpxP family protein refolding chaperone [Candidatus Atribacteria bacterium]